MREELGAEIADLELCAVTEEISQVLGQTYHGIAFSLRGALCGPRVLCPTGDSLCRRGGTTRESYLDACLGFSVG
jgi:hypothetical protein